MQVFANGKRRFHSFLELTIPFLVCAAVQKGFIELTVACLPLPINPVEVVGFRLECDLLSFPPILNDVFVSSLAPLWAIFNSLQLSLSTYNTNIIKTPSPFDLVGVFPFLIRELRMRYTSYRG